MPDRPRLKRQGKAPKVGIVHLGPGAFFRAFNAVYTHDAMAAAGGDDWGILAVSLRSPTARDQLTPQGGVFTSVTLSQDGSEARVIGSIAETLVAPDAPSAIVQRMADPMVRIVSMTITEKGYCHNPADGRLNADHPDIRHDLSNLAAPRTVPGFIVAALAKRRADGARPFTVLSCDNLPNNGQLARTVVLEFAALVDAELADWIKANVPFPSTMVDRITPATTPADIDRLEHSAGYHDPGCVVHERFSQWVIEDNFADGRPDWAAAGAQLVSDVHAHELMKLRCLNGTHSTLAYLGYLSGIETIGAAVSDPAFAALLEKLWQTEITPTVPQPEGEDLPTYCKSLLARFRDTSIQHRTWQIAMDGSQKLPQRLLGTIADNLAAGRTPLGLCLAVAGWMRYVGAVDDAGQPIDVRDPLADQLKAASDSANDAAGKVQALLNIRAIFPEDLAHNDTFRNAVISAYDGLTRHGAKAMIESYVK